jgi:glutamate:Na+ symporter, ESS family
MEEWGIILYFMLIGVLMFVAKLIKTKVPFFNKIVIPTALLGGIIGLTLSLVFAPIIIGEETFIDVDQMGYIVYHALAIGFIALALKREPSKIKKKIWSTGMLITSTYALQAVVGILVFLLLFTADNFIGSGMLVALGFGQGPGLAMSIGRMWNDMLGGNGAVLGASYALIGFFFGGTVGVVLINIMSRRTGRLKPKDYGEDSAGKVTLEIDTIKEISLLDGLTTQGIIISIIYSIVYLILYVSYVTFGQSGIGETVYGLMKGFNFIIGILIALVYKRGLLWMEKKGKNVRFMTNNYMLSNIASASFNVMIAGAALSITLTFLSEYGMQLFVTSIVAGVVTLFYLKFMTKRVYNDYIDEYFIGFFGMLTGVASTGLALLKGVDPNLETPVAEEMVLGSGTAISMALPLFGILFIPSLTYGSPNEMLWNILSLLGCALYVAVFMTILLIRGKRGVNV